jgi:hypothetical protein
MMWREERELSNRELMSSRFEDVEKNGKKREE